MTKPTLHEIAAMPYPSSVATLRLYYDPKWGEPQPDPDKVKKYKVLIKYESCEGVYKYYETINAENAEQAERICEIDFYAPILKCGCRDVFVSAAAQKAAA